MSIHIQIGKNNIECKNKSTVQRLPFKIHADCDAKVKEYFQQYITETDNGLKGSFRGRPLNGNKVKLPEGYTGVVLHESIRPATEKEDRKFYVVHNFDSFVSWNWDRIPSKNDAIMKALDWIDIAEVLHGSIVEE